MASKSCSISSSYKLSLPWARGLLLSAILGHSAFLCAQTITEFPVPTAGSGVFGIVAGPDGSLWFTEPLANKIGRITLSGEISEFALPSDGAPGRIALGPDGNLWFTEYTADRIGRISVSGEITEFPVPTVGSLPRGITGGPDGNLWFAEEGGNRIGRITTSGEVAEYDVPTPQAGLNGVAFSSDGNLWFTESNAFQVGRIGPSGEIREFALEPRFGYPHAIAPGADGRIWFTQIPGSVSTMGRIAPDGTLQEIALATYTASDLTSAPDGDLYFTQSDGLIGRVPLQGSIVRYAIPSGGGNPQGIAVAADGTVWFAEPDLNRIGRLTLGGACIHADAPTLAIDGASSATVTAGSSYTLSWNATLGSQVGQYTVRVSSNGGATYSPLASVTGTAYRGETAAADAGRTLLFEVRAEPDCGTAGASDESASVTLHVTAGAVCARPPAPTMSVDGRFSTVVEAGGSFVLSWTDSLAGEPGTYTILISHDGGATFTAYTATPARSLTVPTDASESGSTLLFAVKAVPACGATNASEASPPVSVEIVAAQPPGGSRVAPVSPSSPTSVDGRP